MKASQLRRREGGLKNVQMAPLSPIPAQDGPRRAGAIRGNPKVLDVGAGDTKGEQVGEELEGKEERGREWAQAGGGGSTSCTSHSHCRGPGQKQ